MENPLNQFSQPLLLRHLPAVDALIRNDAAKNLIEKIGQKAATRLARETIEDWRNKLKQRESLETQIPVQTKELQQEIIDDFIGKLIRATNAQFKRVINATGVLIHTNLGRAPLAEAAQNAIVTKAARYCTLEYDLETAGRGARGRETEELIKELTGAEAALVVNNCAAAAFLVLSVLASNGETIVSRGELVEIGGDFRVPDIMTQSGTKLVEVGTTNRTKLADFKQAITPETRLLMRVHPSNFRIVGFTAMPDLKELAELARANNLLLYEDAGSGALIDLSEYGLKEPVIPESIRAGADVVTFSGDKLLGGCQAGLIVGKSSVIERLRKHPLYRALRVDKITFAVLAATLDSYRRGAHFAEIPILRMLSQSKEAARQKAQNFLASVKTKDIKNLDFELTDGESVVGGGAASLTPLPTTLIAIKSKRVTASQLEHNLRTSNPAVIGRVSENLLLLDLRTVENFETDEIILALLEIDRAIEESKDN